MFILIYVCFYINICQQFHICSCERPSKIMVGFNVLCEMPYKDLFPPPRKYGYVVVTPVNQGVM